MKWNIPLSAYLLSINAVPTMAIAAKLYMTVIQISEKLWCGSHVDMGCEREPAEITSRMFRDSYRHQPFSGTSLSLGYDGQRIDTTVVDAEGKPGETSSEFLSHDEKLQILLNCSMCVITSLITLFETFSEVTRNLVSCFASPLVVGKRAPGEISLK